MKALFLTSIISGPGGTYREGREYEISERLALEWARVGHVRLIPEAPVVEVATVERAQKVRPIRAGR